METYKKNKYKIALSYLIENERWVLPIAFISILLVPIIKNILLSKPLLMGPESYAHLHTITSSLPFTIPQTMLALIGPLLGITALILLRKISEHLGISKQSRTIFLIMAILSPAIIYSFSTLSAHALVITLVLLGLYLFKKGVRDQLALLAFYAATFVDILSTILVALALTLYFQEKKTAQRTQQVAYTALATLLLLNVFLLGQRFIIGPFHGQQILPDLVSDLGGLSGVSFFVCILGVIGLFFIWQKKRRLLVASLIVVLVLAYGISTGAALYLSLFILIVSTVAFERIFERKWIHKDIKSFTLFVLFLGLLFSTASYLDRVSDFGPTSDDIESLNWMRTTIPKTTVVFTGPEHGYYVQALALREPAYLPHTGKGADAMTRAITNALYVTDLFPIFEQRGITHIYITQKMKEALPRDQGILSLLQNERFKLIHSSNDSEVWAFT